jgi:hypothetical protein
MGEVELFGQLHFNELELLNEGTTFQLVFKIQSIEEVFILSEGILKDIW